MADRSTKLRYIIAANPGDLSLAVERLPFKVEIKGSPMQFGKRWIVWFTITKDVEFRSLEL